MLTQHMALNQLLDAVKSGSLSGSEFGEHILMNGLTQVKPIILDSVSDILPVALTVAGAVLVVTLGWRLFRNFTRG